MASPASAHRSQITGEAACKRSTGNFEVTWTVTNDFRQALRLDGVTALPQGTNANLPTRVEGARRRGESSATGVQVVPGSAKFAAVRVDRITWDDGYTQNNTAGAVQLSGDCGKDQPPAPVPPKPEPPKPEPPSSCVPVKDASFTHEFDGKSGTASVTLKDSKLCKDEKQPFALISYGQPATPGGPAKKFDSSTGTVTRKHDKITLKVKQPPCGSQVYLVWGDEIIAEITAQQNYGSRVLGGTAKPGSQSTGPLGAFTAAASSCGDKPAVAFKDSCTEVEITLSNNGTIPAEFFGESKVGDGTYKPFDKPVTVAPDKQEKMVIKAERGLTVRVTSGSTVNVEHRWVKPADCATPPAPTPPPAPPGSGSPSLPVTGASVTMLVIAALALGGLGAGLVVFSRRRRNATTALSE
jgi:LPXTG-motif cell wall-anchored protein